MAKIVDPDQLNQATEVVISTAGKTVQLLVAGNLDNTSPGSTSGVTLQALYSFLKEEWKSDNALNKFKFPLQMFTKTDGQFINGWTFADATSRSLVRDAGWTESSTLVAGIISLGAFDNVADQAYYAQNADYDATVTDFDKSGTLNEAVDITGATAYIKSFLREQGKLYGEYRLVEEQGLAALEPVLYRQPLSNATDIDITESDVNIDGNTPYTGMKLNFLAGSGFTTWADSTVYPAGAVVQELTGSPRRWFFTALGGTSSGTDVQDDVGVTDWAAYDGERQIGTNWYAFNRIMDANTGTAEECYNWLQRQLRKTTDINADDSTTVNQRSGLTMNGVNAELLAFFVGSNLHTRGGLFIDDFDTNSTNDLTFGDITVDGGGVSSVTYLPVVSTERIFPFVAAGTLAFSANLVSEPDGDTRYTMYFDNAGGSLFDSAAAIIVNDQDGDPINGQITAASIAWDFDYDGNVQGGRTPGTDALVHLVAQGLNGAQWIEATYTITRTTGQSVSVNAADERNYANA